MPISHTHKSPPQRAFTLAEAAIVLAIVGIVLGAIWAAGAMVYRNMQIGQTISHLVTVVQNVRNLYASQSSFSSATGTNITSDLVKAEMFPAMILDKSTRLPVTSWGTDIKVYVGSTKDSFKVSFESTLPEETCRSLVGRMGGKGRLKGLVQVEAGGSTYTEASNGLNNLTPTSITGTCNSASFTFKLKG